MSSLAFEDSLKLIMLILEECTRGRIEKLDGISLSDFPLTQAVEDE
ncbi:MAG: hypothetical protein ACUVV4_00850 [Candidatus Bathyarchaeia archaeon]